MNNIYLTEDPDDHGAHSNRSVCWREVSSMRTHFEWDCSSALSSCSLMDVRQYDTAHTNATTDGSEMVRNLLFPTRLSRIDLTDDNSDSSIILFAASLSALGEGSHFMCACLPIYRSACKISISCVRGRVNCCWFSEPNMNSFKLKDLITFFPLCPSHTKKFLNSVLENGNLIYQCLVVIKCSFWWSFFTGRLRMRHVYKISFQTEDDC